MNVSAFKNIKETIPLYDIDLFTYLDHVKSGYWSKAILKVRAIEDKKERQSQKRWLPLVTASGVFSERFDRYLLIHSGILAVDVDDPINGAEKLIAALRNDRYVFSAFVSTSGKGVCILIKIDGTRHRDAYRGFAKYLYDTYREIADTSCINESRARYASWDPDLFLNTDSLTFKKYPPKEKKHKIPVYIHVESDFDEMIQKLAPYNICENYGDWHSVGNALNHAFKESGRQYFQALSASASTYDSAVVDRQYTAIQKYEGSSANKQATVGTIFYYAKLYNVPFYSDRTREVISSTAILRKSGLKPEAIIENLSKFKGITGVDKIVNEAFALALDLPDGESIINDIEKWLTYNYELRYNLVKNKIEINGRDMRDRSFNDLWISARKIFDKDATTEVIDKLINSSMSAEFHPIREFFDRYKDRTPEGVIQEFFDCIKSDTGMDADNFDPEYVQYFGKKWLVSMIAAAHDVNSPLMLVLCGEKHGTGKTEFFRRLLPEELSHYFTNFRMDKDKDSFIQMCEHWLLLDDEMGGRSNREALEFKSLSSKDQDSIRRAYGRFAERMKRLGLLCATSNEKTVINDSDNRRIIPIAITSIDHVRYNNIDKVDLIMEAYHLYRSGFAWEILEGDKDRLNASTSDFKVVNSEAECIRRLYKPPTVEHSLGLTFKTTTDVTFEVNQFLAIKTSTKRIGAEMQRQGYRREYKGVVRGYWVVENTLGSMAPLSGYSGGNLAKTGLS